MTRPLSVVHVDTERGWRGGERQAFWLAQRLARLGHRSIVAARPGEPLAQRAHASGLEVRALAPLSELDPLAALRLRRLLLHERADIVHAHTAHAVALAAAATLGTRTRLVLTRRVSFPLKRNAASRWKYARADALIAVCRAAADSLVASGVDAERVSVVYSGVDLDRTVERTSPEVLGTLGVRSGAPLVVMVAALVDHKDPLTFVRAMRTVHERLPEAQALLVGDGPLRGEVERAIAEHALGGVVHLTGYRGDADSLIAAADVVALSSKDDGIGGVTIDAMSFGRPVAATAAGGIPEAVARDETGLLVPVGDASALGHAIVRLLTDRALATQLGESGRRRARLFSIEETVARTLAVYECVLARETPR